MVSCCRNDLHLARICVASVRYWYPEIPLLLLKDELRGSFDTTEIERAWRVGIFPTERTRHGWGFGKLETLFAPAGDRLLVLDADTAMLGPILERLGRHGSDLVVAPDFVADLSSRYARVVYFDRDRLRPLGLEAPHCGFFFNSGHLVVRTGHFRREDFSPLLEWSTPPRLRYPALSDGGDQGILNLVAMQKAAVGAITLAPVDFACGSEHPALRGVSLPAIKSREQGGYPVVVHWAGPKPARLSGMPRPELLRFFEAVYYSRVPRGAAVRTARALRRLISGSARNLAPARLQVQIVKAVGRTARGLLGSSLLGPCFAQDRLVARVLHWLGGPSRGDSSLPATDGRGKVADLLVWGRRAAAQRRLRRRLTSVSTVAAGSFAGLRYAPGPEVWCNEFPKLLGTYERELQAALAPLLAARPPVVVEVGAGEGYFALGLGRAVGASQILIIEARPALRRAGARLAEANGLADRIRIDAHWDEAAIRTLDFSRGGVVRWNEAGCERELLDPALIAHLERAHLIVETHDLPLSPQLEELREAYRESHHCQILREVPNVRRIVEWESALVNPVAPLEREIAFAESRPLPVVWVLLTPRCRL